MKEEGADEIILETEITNLSALRLYESFGFIRDKRLLSYYLNGNDAYKLKLYVKWVDLNNRKKKMNEC